MTLILGGLTERFVILASDRRVVRLSDGSVIDDETNKHVVLCGHFHLGYTGLAEVAGTRTDIWLVETLSREDPKDYFRALAANATRLFASIRLPDRRKRHAFLAVGWSNDRDGQLVPLCVVVSNALDASGHWSDGPRRAFDIRVSRIPVGERSLVRWAGAEPTPDDVRRIRRLMRRLTDHSSGPNAAGRILATYIRMTAARNRTVGNSMLISALPRMAVPANTISLSFVDPLLSLDEARALYVPSGTVSPVQYGPSLVCPGLAIRDPEVWTEKPPWWTD